MNRLAILTMLTLIGCAKEPSTVQQSLCQAGTGCCTGSPLVVDLAGDGVHLTGPDDGVPFALHAGIPGMWAWTARGSDDAFLALDRNDDGLIGDGTELFGDGSIQIRRDWKDKTCRHKIRIVLSHDVAMSPTELSHLLDENVHTVRGTLMRMLSRGEVRHTGHKTWIGKSQEAGI